jgi:thiol-disulfide isomerase/thioredoxin
LNAFAQLALSKSIASAKISAPALVILLGSFMFSCTSQKGNDNQPTPVLSGPSTTTYPMPPLTASAQMGWALSDGHRVTLADYAGKVLVLDFYATWCAPCRESIPRLNALQNQYGAQGLHIVGLNVGGPDDRIKVPEFARELAIQYPLGFPDKALTDLFLSDDQTIPQTFIFGRDGQLVKRFIGYQQSFGTELEKVISETVNSKQQTANSKTDLEVKGSFETTVARFN